MQRIKNLVSSVLTHPTSGSPSGPAGANRKPAGSPAADPSKPVKLPAGEARTGLARLEPQPGQEKSAGGDGKAIRDRALQRGPAADQKSQSQGAKPQATAASGDARPPTPIAVSNQRLRDAIEKAIDGTDPAGKDRLRSSLTNAVFAQIFRDHGDAYDSGTLSTATLERLIESARKQIGSAPRQ